MAEKRLHAVWISGHNGEIERSRRGDRPLNIGNVVGEKPRAVDGLDPFLISEFIKRSENKSSYSEYLKARDRVVFDGNIVDIGGHAAAAKTTNLFGAEYTVFDIGANDVPKTGDFYVHYALPTPVIYEGQRTLVRDFMMLYNESNSAELSIKTIRVVDFDLFKNTINFDATFSGKDIGPKRPFMRLSLGEKPVIGGIIVQLGFFANKAIRATVSIQQLGVDYLV